MGRLGRNLVDNRVGEAAYSKGCAVFILQVMDIQLLSNKIYLYPEQILRAWYKHERKYASRGKRGIRRKQGIHYKKMNTYYFVPFDSIDHITMNSKYLESEEPPYEGIRAIIESLKRFIVVKSGKLGINVCIKNLLSILGNK